VIIFGALLAVPVAAGVWFFLPPPKPTATAKLYAPLQIKAPLSGDHPDQPMDRATHIALIRSHLVLAAALRSSDIANLPVIKQQPADEQLSWLAKNLEVSFEGPEVIKISMTLADGDQARMLVDAVKNAYLTEIHGRSAQERKQRFDRLTDLSQKADTDLKNKQGRVRTLTEGSNVSGDPQTMALRQKMAQEALQRTHKDVGDLKRSIRQYKLEETGLTAKINGAVDIPQHVLDEWIETDPEVVINAQTQAAYEEKIEKLKKTLREPEKHPDYIANTAKLAELKQDAQKLREKVKGRAVADYQTQSKANASAKLQVIKEQLALATEMEAALVQDIPILEKEAKSLVVAGGNLEVLKLELKQAEELSSKIKLALTNMTLEQDVPPRVLDMDKTMIIRPDADAKRFLFAGVGGMAAFALVGGLVGFLEVRQRRIESPDAVTRGLGLRIVGTVPRPPSFLNRLPGGGGGPERWQAALTEAINCTRTMLLHAEGMSAVRVLQVTSSVSGEGKTTLAAHLAVSLALAGRKTLLVDGDLRNPNAHKPFNLPSGPGLCEVLRGEQPLADVTQPTPVAGLQVLPAGQYNTETLQALAAAGPVELFARLRAEYDIVIVDSSPVLPVTDPLLLARHTDGVIVAMLQGVSRMPLVEETNHRLNALGIRVLGAVVNGTAARAYGYGGSYPLQARA
jgi:capsular exopolysaccharide synthesis family protein